MSTDHDSDIDMADILIVDDESANLKLLSEMIGREGYQVRPANSPRLAIESALGKPPDLILLDVRMPDMDGFEVCGILKQNERTRDIPVLFISALQDTKDKVRGFEAGGVDFISKPFQEEEVLARIRRHLMLRNVQLNLAELVDERTAELAKSEQLARTLLNATTDVTQLIDEDGIILDLNDAMAEALGGTREELIGTCVFDRFSPETAEKRKSQVRQAIANEKHIRYVDRIGPDVVYDTGIYPVVTPAGEKHRVVIFAHDITENERTLQALQKSESKFRRLVENVPDVIWTTDATGKTTYISENVREIFGFSQEEVGRPHPSG
jgi:PAS domain S-box-containing protein